MPPAHDVFICHSSEDRAIATAACNALEAAGIHCWIAPRDPIAGIPYARQLIDAIEHSRILLLIFSDHSSTSKHVLREVEAASSAGITILPMRIKDALPSDDLNYYIKPIHCLEATAPPLEDRLRELVLHASSLLGIRPRDTADNPAAPEAARKRDARTNLPAQVTSFVGRDRDIAAVVALVRQCRLVTLCGTGGVGKTRCAIEVGLAVLDEFEDGVWFIDLSTIRDSADVLFAVVTTLKLVVSQSAGPETLRSSLAGQHLLLILDNCEHVIDEVRKLVAEIKPSCERVAILSTSREAFNVYGEQLYRMPALDTPSAVRLFSERATAAIGRFSLEGENRACVEAICNRLEGLPLAIELAAARIKMFSPAQLEQRLAGHIDALGSGRRELERQQTLRATFDWSYELLKEDERVLLRRLAVFVGTFALETAGAVCSDRRLTAGTIDTLLESLLDKSLVQSEITGQETRHRLLEPVREYASEKLADAGETAQFAKAHAQEYANLAEAAYRGWGAPDAIWLPKAASDLPNFRSALKWAFSGEGDPLVGQRIAGAVRSIWSRFDPVEGCRWIAESLDRTSDETPLEIVARLELVRAQWSLTVADIPTALQAGRRALELYARFNDPLAQAEAHLFAGAAAGLMNDSSAGKALLNEALQTFREMRADRQIGSALQYLALMHLVDDEIDAARSTLTEALEIMRATPGADRSASHMSQALAEVEFRSGDAQAALRLALEALEKDRLIDDDVLVVFDLCNVCRYQIALGRLEEAAGTACRALELSRRVQVQICTALALQRLAAIAASRRPDDGTLSDTLQALAAQLIGFIDSRMRDWGAVRDYTEQKEYDQTVEALRTELGEDRLDALRAQGSHWTESEAVAVANRIGAARTAEP